MSKIESVLRKAVEVGFSDMSRVAEFVKDMPWHIHRTAGGDTSCVELEAGGVLLILDAGTGIRRLGLELMRRCSGNSINAHILLSHTHWDHICGFPFFAPAYVPGNSITLYGPQSMLEHRFRLQQESQFFPVSLAAMGADIQFMPLEKQGRFNIGEVEIETFPLDHPGGCLAYRVSHNGTALLYATDSEYQDLTQSAMQPYLDFFRGADVLIFDAQYTTLESIEKQDWGHSTALVGVEIALRAGVKNLVFTHHDSKRYLEIQGGDRQLTLHMAYEGFEIKL